MAARGCRAQLGPFSSAGAGACCPSRPWPPLCTLGMRWGAASARSWRLPACLPGPTQARLRPRARSQPELVGAVDDEDDALGLPVVLLPQRAVPPGAAHVKRREAQHSVRVEAKACPVSEGFAHAPCWCTKCAGRGQLHGPDGTPACAHAAAHAPALELLHCEPDGRGHLHGLPLPRLRGTCNLVEALGARPWRAGCVRVRGGLPLPPSP